VIRIGCSGWNYAHWRNGVFYPPRLPARDWLRYYARFFGTVEVNSTFYRLPKQAPVARWVAETPTDFLFAVKTSRYLTHVKRLRDVAPNLSILLERIEPLVRSHKLGPLLWQLPPTFRRDDDCLAAALEVLPPGLRHAFEFRHESWFCDPVYDLLRRHDVALVIGDRPAVHTFQSRVLTTGFTYLRFHSGSRGANGNYSHRELDDWARRISGWSREVDVYAYFNNDWEGYAIENALWLAERLGRPVQAPRTELGALAAAAGAQS
jgi:uncharacterized protein YecE (DUF72 family)